MRLQKLELVNYRCFGALELAFEPDMMILFAENGGGKTALLHGLAMGLALLQPRTPRDLLLNVERDVRRIPDQAVGWEPAGPCTLTCTAQVGEQTGVEWSATVSPSSRRRSNRLSDANDAIERVRRPGERWPLIAYYGTGRLNLGKISSRRRQREFQDRWDGYANSLDPSAADRPLLDWLRDEAFGDLARHRRGEPERRFDLGVLDAMQRATPGVDEVWYDPAIDSPMVHFQNGHRAEWAELSDGYHVYLALIGDIARRSVILNGQDGAEAPLEIEGVVLVDEIDLHLHPRWQRVVLDGLRAAFPKLQFILSTHSPQVLSSARNRQVRRFEGWNLQETEIFVEGRDSNAILRDHMDTQDRGLEGQKALDELYSAIDREDIERAQKLLSDLRAKWGDLDPELIRAEGLVDEEG